MKISIDDKLKTVLDRFERPYINITSIIEPITGQFVGYAMTIGECGHRKFNFTGPSIIGLIEEALVSAIGKTNKYKF